MTEAVQEPIQEPVVEAQSAPQDPGQPQEQPPEKPKGPPEGVIRRMGELTAARKAAEDRAARAEAELAAYRQRSPSEDGQQAAPAQHPNVQELARVMAQDMVQTEIRQKAVVDKIQGIETAGRKEFGDEFDRAVQNLQMAGIGGQEFIQALTSVPNAEKVVRYLGDAENIEEALKLATLSPVEMAVQMVTLSGKAAKAYAKGLSNAPAPIAPVDGNGRPEGAEPDPKDTDAWMRWRNETARRRK